MNKADFFQNLAEYSQAKGFRLITRADVFGSKTQAFSIGQDSKLSDLRALTECGDAIGINIHSKRLFLRIAIDADVLSDEALVDRLATIHKRAQDFIEKHL